MRGRGGWSTSDVLEQLGGVLCAAALGLIVGCPAGGLAQGRPIVEGFSVIPVTVEMEAGQRTAVLTIQNNSDKDFAFQVRAFSWDQPSGDDQLRPTDALTVSPPLGSLPVGATQVVRLVLKGPLPAREAAYRIWLDQIPPRAAAGQVSFALRLSIPVFIEPPGRITPRVSWSVQQQGGASYLTAVNDGTRRQVVRGLALSAPSGGSLALESNVSPYILPGATRRWRILTNGTAPTAGESLRLTARADTGPIDQPVPVIRAGP